MCNNICLSSIQICTEPRKLGKKLSGFSSSIGSAFVLQCHSFESSECQPNEKTSQILFCLIFSLSLQANIDELEAIEEPLEVLLESDLSFYYTDNCHHGM